MYVILVYDCEPKRGVKVLKKCRQYLTWVQNSVFEGDITPALLKKLKYELKSIINEQFDSIIIYEFRTLTYYNRETIGLEKGGDEQFF